MGQPHQSKWYRWIENVEKLRAQFLYIIVKFRDTGSKYIVIDWYGLGESSAGCT